IKDAEVHQRDEHGRGIDVTWRAAAMGRSARVRLEYDYSDAPRALRWKLFDGDVLRRYDGHYLLSPSTEEPGATDVEYQLSVDVVVPLPGIVKRRGEARIMKAALPDLKRHIEAGRPQPTRGRASCSSPARPVRAPAPSPRRPPTTPRPAAPAPSWSRARCGTRS